VISTTPMQQQIYAPDTTLNRWMASLAVDGQGNMALGYSTSNETAPNFPSIAYSGRLVTDPLNTLPQSEVQLVAGAASQTKLCGDPPQPCSRWGDYTSMSVDPVDDTTFWYTNEYYSSAANGASGNWQTRIGSFKFPQSGGPPGGVVQAVAIDPSTPATLYTGTEGGGVFKSTNAGTNWTAVNSGLMGARVNALAIDPSTTSTLYAGTIGGVFKSTNGGAGWTSVSSGLTGLSVNVYALAIDASTNATVYAGTLGGVFKSTNGGTSWSAVNSGITNTSIEAVAIDPSTASTLFVGTDGGGVFKSTNGGASWTAINSGLVNTNVRALAIDPFIPATLYAGTQGGVFRSANGGRVGPLSTLA